MDNHSKAIKDSEGCIEIMIIFFGKQECHLSLMSVCN